MLKLQILHAIALWTPSSDNVTPEFRASEAQRLTKRRIEVVLFYFV